MYRSPKKVDANQPDIVAVFRRFGFSVEHLHEAGNGVPDLLVGVMGMNFLVEVKDGAKPPSARKLTPDQLVWHSEWRGQKVIIKSVDEAIAFSGMMIKFVRAVHAAGLAIPETV